ncbi:MAG: FAD-dependent oxidoreductase [Micrococcales bacterium]|nr:FAD-dependent oxidoreductase [Micrococcales bacterium]
MFNCDARSKNALKSVVIDGSAYDVVIYGGSPAGVAAARSAAELGKSVLLLSESGLFGGAISKMMSVAIITMICIELNRRWQSVFSLIG